MNTNDTRFAAFEELMDIQKIYVDPTVTFEAVCMWLHIDPSEMDTLLEEELGYTGEGLMELFRHQHREHRSKIRN